ncbi:putative class I glutamine amidotransferase [Xylariaceae sp. FL0255]|nr:putative class I glutamine amidotransferase [Xylariaceae sp. FL0255]
MGSNATKAPVRLAILEADTPMKGIDAKYTGYGGVFTHLFQRACDSLKPPVPLESQLDLSVYHVVNDKPDVAISYPDPETIDAILITGSKHDSFENHQWILDLISYTKRCLEGGRVRVIGVCFGHQIVARALGAKVNRNPKGWEVSVIEHELTDEGKKILGMDKMRINQMHRDAALEVPPGVLLLARTPVCENQAMCIPQRMISVQGHPEFDEAMVTEILNARKYGGVITGGLYEDGARRAGAEQDGVAVAQAFLRFLHE